LKDSFIADVTHELRTPLTVLKGTVETLEDGAIDDRGYRSQLLSTMARETERLIRMVNQLLLLARSDAGALYLEIVTLDPVELVEERIAHFSLAANTKEIHLRTLTKGDNSDYQALGDRNRTLQVLDNLLDNALRYAPTGSEIIIQMEAQDGLILCSIEDEGPGIPEQDLPKLFDRFFRVETARDRRSGGTGLGLSIARSLVEAQGGWITAANRDGSGARIRFSLPAKN
jgi:signal transduction histidine kinase